MEQAPEWIGRLPAVNAALNAISAALLTAGYLFIRRRRIGPHRACMVAAFATSALFLASYLTLHFHVGSTHFTATGWVRPVYFVILVSHVVLAAAVVPLATATLWRAWRERFQDHARLARWTLPIWLYVSVTGVLIYLMLYHLYPAP